ncbi:hypothetical protein AgCh_030397 [Apium graveolens]
MPDLRYSQSGRVAQYTLTVRAQIAKVQGIESFCENAWEKNKKKIELIDGLSTDVESMDDESHPLKEEKEHPLKAH